MLLSPPFVIETVKAWAGIYLQEHSATLTADERCSLGLGQDFEKDFQLRKKHLFAVNRVFATEG